MSSFEYPKDLVARLREQWGVVTYQGIPVNPLPSDSLLVPLVETAYFASLTSEELRPTKFAMFVGEPPDGFRPVSFGREPEISVSSIRRLAPAVSGQQLGVRVGSTFRGSTFWGFADGSEVRCLSLEVHGPGRLSIGSRITSWLALDGGKVTEAGSDSAAVLGLQAFREAFNESLARNEIPIEKLWWAPFSSWLSTLLSGPSLSGHGGAIFVVPESEAEGSWRNFARVKYSTNHARIWQSILAIADARDGGAGSHDAFNLVDRELKRVAGLTQVDGAVIMTDRFRVLGFGVEFTAPPLNGQPETVLHNRVPKPVEEYGTRHRSAFRLVGACPYATGFVCSQDGGVRGVRADAQGSVTLIT